MDLFREIALAPDLFDPSHHDTPQVQRWALAYIREGLRDSWFVRSLHDGAWFKEASQRAAKSVAARELLEYLCKRKLLVPAPHCSAATWVEEALASHRQRPLGGLVLDDLADTQVTDPPTSTVTALPDAKWWTEHPSSMDIERTPEALAVAFRLLLLVGRQIHLVDRHIDPAQSWYERTLHKILSETLKNPSKPELTFHTSLIVFNTRAKTADRFEWVNKLLEQHGRRGRVCVWDPDSVKKGFHDRYLLTDVAGCQIGAGFQRASRECTTISVLSDADRRTYLDRFDPNPNRAVGLCWNIAIGAVPKPADPCRAPG
jgi:hypothetical protein